MRENKFPLIGADIYRPLSEDKVYKNFMAHSYA